MEKCGSHKVYFLNNTVLGILLNYLSLFLSAIFLKY